MYDPVRHRLLAVEQGGSRAHIWARSLGVGGGWSYLETANSPPYVGDHVVYDPIRDRLLIVNPGAAVGSISALSLNGTPTWTDIGAPGGPNPYNYYPSVVYDSQRDRLIVFGGIYLPGLPPTCTNEVWAFPLAGPPGWVQITPQGIGPSRSEHYAVYNPGQDQMVIYSGGCSSASQLSDAWALSLADPPTWSQLTLTGPQPPPRRLGSVAFDPIRRRLLLFGGYSYSSSTGQTYYDDLWALSFDGSPTWTELVGSGSGPTSRLGAGCAFDSDSDRFVLVGGHDGTTYPNDLWAYSLAVPSWENLEPNRAWPDQRWWHSAVFDTARDRMLISGGLYADPMDVWSLTVGADASWTRLAPAGPAPPARYAHGAIYDPVDDQMLVFGGEVFGGQAQSGPSNEVWRLSLGGTPGWQLLAPAGTAPSARYDAGTVFDPVRRRMLVIGGQNGSTLFNEVWALTLDGVPTWSQLLPTGGAPTARYGHSAIYDPVRDRVVVFGGNVSGYGQSDAWELLLAPTPQWQPLSPSNLPPGRYHHTAIYDPVGDQLIIFGGNSGGSARDFHFFSDTWALPLTGPEGWVELTQTNVAPGGLEISAGVYHPTLGRMILFGGNPDGANPAGLWTLALNAPGPTPPVAPSNLNATLLCPPRASLTWQDNSSDETSFEIQLQIDASGTWVSAVVLATNATSWTSGALDYGHTYEYRARACAGPLCSPWTTGASVNTGFPFELVSASTDKTLYRNGIDTVEFTVVSRANCGQSMDLHLSLDVEPSIGSVMHVADESLSLSPGGEHISHFSWLVPDSSFAWEFDGNLTLIDRTAALAPIVRRMTGWFQGNPLPAPVIQQHVEQVSSCWSTDVECKVQLAEYVPVFGTLASISLAVNDFCKMGSFFDSGRQGEAAGAFWAGQTKLITELSLVVLDNLVADIPVVGAAFKVTKVIHTTGELARNCWGGLAADLLGWLPKPGGITSEVSVVDSLATWTMMGIDSTNADVADALFVAGDCYVRVEADGGWADADSMGLMVATVENITTLGSVAMTTTNVHEFHGLREDNPRSESTFRIESRASQPINMTLLHRQQDGSRVLLRYAQFAATGTTIMTLTVADNLSEYPMLVDLNGDGRPEQIHYPGGRVVGLEETTSLLGLELSVARPNPFRGSTTIAFSVPRAGHTRLDVYDVAGRLVVQLLNGWVRGQESHAVLWDGRSTSGATVPSGMYFCHLKTDQGALTQRLILVR